MFKLFQISLLLLSIIGFSGCSYSPDSLKDNYNDLQAKVSDDLKEGIDLSPRQEVQIENYAKVVLLWHRHNKLPEYAYIFARLSEQVKQDDPSVTALQSYLDKMEGLPHLYQATHLTAKLAKVAQTLTDRQVSQLESYLDNVSQEEALSIKTRPFQVEIRDGISTMFKFLGVKLSPEQMIVLNQDISKFHDIRMAEHAADREGYNRLIAVLKQRKQPQFIAHFTHILKQMEIVRLTGDAGVLQQENRRTNALLLKHLILSMNSEQKEQFSRQLLSISQTLSELANE